MSTEMLVNVSEGVECRVAVVENGLLQELYVERASQISQVGNIYKGKVVNLEPGIQAAFIDFGQAKNGFLHISDLHPKYFTRKNTDNTEKIGKRKALKERPPIQECLKKGDSLIVQVTKDGIKTKGPTLSTYIALPGKYLVMMPWMQKLGVSHKVEDDQERERLRKILDSLDTQGKAGFIIRTAAEGASKRDISSDLNYLKRLWSAIRKRIDTAQTPSELYQESDLVIRTLRDVFNSKVSKVLCDSEIVAKKVRDFLGIAMPRYKRRAIYYDGKTPLFHKYSVEQEIARIQSRRVELKSGGSVIIEPTEALVAIDVNSGRYRKHENAEQTAYKINLEAAKEIVRQLKLRDLGGLIICDFIDMRNAKHKREVEKVFRTCAREDRARAKVLRMSQFGIIEMTRQRMRPSLQSSTNLECPYCKGTGFVKSHESMSIEVMRELDMLISKNAVKRIDVAVSPEFANYLQNEKRVVLAEIEANADKKINVCPEPEMLGESSLITCYDERGSVVKT